MFTIVTDESLLNKQSYVLDSAVTGTILNGYLAHLAADGDVVSAQAANVLGVFYDFLSDIEPPTTDNLVTHKAGKQVTVVMGRFTALMTADLFQGGVAPAVGADLYGDHASGLLSTTGTSNIVATCTATRTTRGVSGDVTLYQVEADFPVPFV